MTNPLLQASKPSKRCPSCWDRKVITVEGKDRAIARRCPECDAPCDVCGGDGVVFDNDWTGNVVSTVCECRVLDQRIGYFNGAALPRRYAHTTFDNYETGSDSQAVALADLMTCAEGFRPGTRGIGLSGKVGTGKTHLIAALTRDLTLNQGIAVRFIEFSHLMSQIRAGYAANQSADDTIANLVDVPVLVIDELGKGIDKEWQVAILDELVSKRYNRDVSTFFTTNYPFSLGHQSGRSRELFERTALPDRIGVRMTSRLSEMCALLTLEGPDYRRLRSEGKRSADHVSLAERLL